MQADPDRLRNWILTAMADRDLPVDLAAQVRALLPHMSLAELYDVNELVRDHPVVRRPQA